MPELLNQDSCERIWFYCCPCDSPAVYVAFIIEVILLKSYLAQELHIYSSSPQLWSQIFLITDAKWYIIFQLCKHSFFHTSPDAAIHTILRALILSSLVCVIKRRGRRGPQISGRSSVNTRTCNDTEDVTTNRKVLIETLQPLPCALSPSAPLETCGWLKGTFFPSSAGSLPPRY